MPTGIYIPADWREPIAARQYDSLEDYQAAVDGYIEYIHVVDAMALFANEEGKFYGLPINERATMLWQLLIYPTDPGDVLCGNVVLVGPADGDGATMDVPSELQSLLCETSVYAVEIRTRASDLWQPATNRFGDYFEAVRAVLSVADHGATISAVRVVPAT